MLADELLGFLTSKKSIVSANYRKFEPRGIEKFISDLRASQKFVLTKNSFELIKQSLMKKPTAIVSGIDYVRPPFPLTWLEYESAFKGSDEGARPEAPSTKRVGFLIQDSEPCFIINMVYSFSDKNKEYTLSLLSFIWEKEAGGKLSECIRHYGEIYKKSSEFDSKAVEEAYAKNSDMIDRVWDEKNIKKMDEEALELLGQRFSPVACPYTLGVLSKIKEVAGSGGMADVMINMQADWYGEAVIPIATMLLLNCKNALQQIPCESLAKINKSRKLRNKLPLMEFKTLDLNLTKEQQKTYSECSTEAEKDRIRLHWVRGHFKRRATGLFWWSPHLAGNPEAGFIEKEYIA